MSEYSEAIAAIKKYQFMREVDTFWNNNYKSAHFVIKEEENDMNLFDELKHDIWNSKLMYKTCEKLSEKVDTIEAEHFVRPKIDGEPICIGDILTPKYLVFQDECDNISMDTELQVIGFGDGDRVFVLSGWSPRILKRNVEALKFPDKDSLELVNKDINDLKNFDLPFLDYLKKYDLTCKLSESPAGVIAEHISKRLKAIYEEE